MFQELKENELYDLSADGILGDIGHAIGYGVGWVAYQIAHLPSASIYSKDVQAYVASRK
jgi:hypothetical protein